jgi:hypothetical protein
MYAKEPVPTMVLKSNGTNLTPERITRLLESWKVSRSTRSTAFLNADVELQALGFDPAKLQLNEARQYVATEMRTSRRHSGKFLICRNYKHDIQYNDYGTQSPYRF